MVISLRKGMTMERDYLTKKLVELQYERNDINFIRNKFRVRGDVVEIFPAYQSDTAVRVEFFGDEVDRISEINTITGEVKNFVSHAAIYPASHYIVPADKMKEAIEDLRAEADERVKFFREQGKLIEAQRIAERTNYDIEMLTEIGFCKGIENYSRVLSRRPAGSVPYTLLDYFPEDFLLFVDYGFRLPSALDNRPLNFDEFYNKLNQIIYVSATPGELEKEHSTQIVEQVIRPTGLLDPMVEVRPVDGQIDDLLSEINARVAVGERVLVTTLTKKMAEDLTTYLENLGVRIRYMHHDVDTIERMELIRDLRLGEYDVLVGINLLREGLDIPEVSLVAILDADKEGFLRSETSLIQTIGRAARNDHGKVIMYADAVTGSMERAITETLRRRAIQQKYNEEHGITPQTIKKDVREILEISTKESAESKGKKKRMSAAERQAMIQQLTLEMQNAAKMLEFEHAAYLRDKIKKLKEQK